MHQSRIERASMRRFVASVATIAVGETVSLVGSAGASTSDPSDSSVLPSTSSGTVTLAWNYVAFGDSSPAGEHCNGCTPFPELWAADLDAHPGWDIEFTDFTGQHERSTAQSKGTASLLEALQTDEETRAAVESADIILIAAPGPNETDQAVELVLAETCGGVDGFDCLRDLGPFWSENFDAILTEIESLRDGKPTAIRFVNTALTEPIPEAVEALGEDVVNAGVALLSELHLDAMCDSAQVHDAICIDIRPVLNGASLDQPVDENAPETMRVITDLLLATGLPELT
jgi:hypothetical protein